MPSRIFAGSYAELVRFPNGPLGLFAKRAGYARVRAVFGAAKTEQLIFPGRNTGAKLFRNPRARASLLLCFFFCFRFFRKREMCRDQFIGQKDWCSKGLVK